MQVEDQEPAIIILIGDPERQISSGSRVVQQIYGLTNREADVALLLMQGESLREVCEKMKIHITTARTLLYRVLAKTGCQRQAELMRLLLSGPINTHGE